MVRRTEALVDDIFLMHDGEVFELSVRGAITAHTAASIVAAVRHLPAGCRALIDLTGVPAIDPPGALALRAALLDGHGSHRHVVIAATDLQVRAALVSSDVDHLVPVLPSLELARRSLAVVPA
jgi:hypothetical protein